MTTELKNTLKTKSAHQIEPMAWGRLEWYVSAAIGNSETMTVGKCVINPGDANGRHLHPNCDEVLTVLKGKIVHTWNDEEFEMNEGDVISIPSGVFHNARNIGEDVAELAISFSSAYRTTQDEGARPLVTAGPATTNISDDQEESQGNG